MRTKKSLTPLCVLAGLGLASLVSEASAADTFIRPETRIRGCIAIVDKVRDGSISPTEWLEQNKEEFADLQLELKSRNYPPQKSKDMMMGMAITLCMAHKVPGYVNTCVSARDEEKRDIQIMRTAHIAECWSKQTAVIQQPYVPPPPPQPPEPPAPKGPVLPPMSAEDMQQFREDAAIISNPPAWSGPVLHLGERFNSCMTYWQSLHFNRSPEARQVLYAVRVARCMHRANFAMVNCPWSFGAMLQPGCYARL